MSSELFTCYGATDGSAASGDFSLYSDIVYGTFTSFRIPKGMKAKIWCKRIGGEKCEVILNYSRDVSVASPSYNAHDRQDLASEGQLHLEKRRPMVVRSLTGTEGFKLSWNAATAAVTYLGIEIEITEDD